MAEISLDQALQMAVQYHQSGQLQQAEEAYRQILSHAPNHPDALHLLGVLAGQAGQPEAGIELIQRAIACSPGQAVYHNNLGNLLEKTGRREEALAAYRRALELKPDYASAYNNLGSVLDKNGDVEAAENAYRESLRLRPDVPDVLINLGNVLNEQAQFAEALPYLRRAIALNPNLDLAHSNLGTALMGLGQAKEAFSSLRRAIAIQPEVPEHHSDLGAILAAGGQNDEAIECFNRALRLKPDNFNTILNLAGVLDSQGRHPEASACYCRAIELKPESSQVYYHLGVSRAKTENIDEAIAAFRSAIELDPKNARAHHGLGNALRDAGQVAEACACYQEAVKIKPDFSAAYDNLLFSLGFHPDYDAGAIFREHERWNREWGEPRKEFVRHANERTPDRRLRVGYVSPDFRYHVLGRYLYSLLREHNRATMGIYCYSSVGRPDDITELFRGKADVWRDIRGLSDQDAADLIRSDGIDILVDPNLHMADNRLGIFARKPAPVQICFAAYPGTTGLTTIDYRLTDPYLDPPGADTSVYSEKTLRLPATFWCYDPLGVDVMVNPLPAESAGLVTFGCLNHFAKVHDGVLRLWSEVLKAVPGSRLHLLSLPEAAVAHRQRVLDVFAREGIVADRISFVSPRPRPEYLALYHAVDISLDTFPYNGHTTSLDSLWMGVPVVTLVGRTVVGRAGLSQLTNLGLPELIAHTPDEYVQICRDLGMDLPRLADLRSTLRSRMERSPLMDAKGFARGIEAAYRQAWREWCLSRVT